MTFVWWSEQDLAALVQMRECDMSYATCAVRLERTRSAVAGAVRRYIKGRRGIQSPAERNAHRNHKAREANRAPRTWNERALTETWAERKSRRQGELGR